MIRKEQGFTIVELMIATAIFSIVLMLCSFAIIHIGRMYYKGVITNRTQDVSRKVIDDISRAIQFGSAGVRTGTGSFPNTGTVQALCIGGVRYTFSSSRPLGNTLPALHHVLWKDRISETEACNPLDLSQESPGGDEGVELLSENMRVPRLEVVPSGTAWTVHIRIAHGDGEDLFEDGNNFGVCKGGSSTGQFCAVSALNTTVTKRL